MTGRTHVNYRSTGDENGKRKNRTTGIARLDGARSAQYVVHDEMGVPRVCRACRHLEPGFKNGRLPEPSGASAWGRTPAH